VALLLAAAAWSRAVGQPVIAITIDHGVRRSAAAEVEFVAQLCARLGVRHIVERWENPPIEIGQASARTERYRLLGHSLSQAGGQVLVTAHTEDDQAETVLMRAASGSTIVGLASMRQVAEVPVWPEGRGLTLLRPFLGLSRADIRRMLRAEGVSWCEDPSNTNPAYERVRLRKLIEIQPTLRAHGLQLLRAARRMRRHQDASVLELLTASEAWPGGVIAIASTDWRRAPLTVRMRVLQTALACAAGTDRLARRGSLSLCTEHLSGGDTRPSALGGALAWRRGETIFIARDPGEVSRPVTLGHRGEACWDGRYRIGVDAPGRTLQFGVLDAERALPPATRARLRTLPVPARMSQLACQARDGALIGLPALEPVAGVHVTDCVAHRLDHGRNLLAADLSV
jgi:tRNA(Ile)-lysidine synthase